eukprot:8481344-Pyramimonas_sp.AAC.1
MLRPELSAVVVFRTELDAGALSFKLRSLSYRVKNNGAPRGPRFSTSNAKSKGKDFNLESETAMGDDENTTENPLFATESNNQEPADLSRPASRLASRGADPELP